MKVVRDEERVELDFNHIGSRLSTETPTCIVAQFRTGLEFQPHRLTVEH